MKAKIFTLVVIQIIVESLGVEVLNASCMKSICDAMYADKHPDFSIICVGHLPKEKKNNQLETTLNSLEAKSFNADTNAPTSDQDHYRPYDGQVQGTDSDLKGLFQTDHSFTASASTNNNKEWNGNSQILQVEPPKLDLPIDQPSGVSKSHETARKGSGLKHTENSDGKSGANFLKATPQTGNTPEQEVQRRILITRSEQTGTSSEKVSIGFQNMPREKDLAQKNRDLPINFNSASKEEKVAYPVDAVSSAYITAHDDKLSMVMTEKKLEAVPVYFSYNVKSR